MTNRRVFLNYPKESTSKSQTLHDGFINGAETTKFGMHQDKDPIELAL